MVADIQGIEEPERFVLVHGHIDSWHVGIGEHRHRRQLRSSNWPALFHGRAGFLRRSLRFAWWPRHSTGRDFGSTWFADQFGLDLAENCATPRSISIPPGCRWATRLPALIGPRRPTLRANGDQAMPPDCPPRVNARYGPQLSSDNIGITSFFMCSPPCPPRHGRRRDTTWSADAGAILPGIHRGRHAGDRRSGPCCATCGSMSRRFRGPPTRRYIRSTSALTCLDILATLDRYQQLAGDAVDLLPARTQATLLGRGSRSFLLYDRRLSRTVTIPEATAKRANVVPRRESARRSIPLSLNFTRTGLSRGWHTPPLRCHPCLIWRRLSTWRALEPGPHGANVLATHLVRGRNRVAWTLHEARKAVASALE